MDAIPKSKEEASKRKRECSIVEKQKYYGRIERLGK